MKRFLKVSIIIVVFTVLIFRCSSKNSLASNASLQSPDYFPVTLEIVEQFEHEIGSKDVSYEYTIGIDTSLYPNKFGYKLTQVKRFLRSSSHDKMDYTVVYFGSPDDSVRIILHEWNVSKNSDVRPAGPSTTDIDSPQIETITNFQIKFDQLESTFIAILGSPDVRIIESKFLDKTERDDIKWTTNAKLSAYLLMFKRDVDTYRQIRLMVYPR